MSTSIFERDQIPVSASIARAGQSALNINAMPYKIISVDLGGQAPDVVFTGSPYQHGDVPVRSRLLNGQKIITLWVYGDSSQNLWARFEALKQAVTLPMRFTVNLTVDGASLGFTSYPAQVAIQGNPDEQKQMLFRRQLRVQIVFPTDPIGV